MCSKICSRCIICWVKWRYITAREKKKEEKNTSAARCCIHATSHFVFYIVVRKLGNISPRRKILSYPVVRRTFNKNNGMPLARRRFTTARSFYVPHYYLGARNRKLRERMNLPPNINVLTYSTCFFFF